ncbi:NTP transferase domain-containing protein [Brevibacillus sp. SYP-B805]|uniref:sugar phosphate nucleotidyltransferase n=1 Tax=Brevibacillus sp. SYP-B805 TaxID=1578199 RepID=UPI0013EDC3C7|nr:sugar phosphate nucleotidyltransferase [Brevibacillus sp. SYP-B805]NGQ93754.1 NTP transferase domain-containing protein [Brevibacillus sp. SYP-B805]
MKAVIMAGGKGTRLRPLTSHLPKPMMPLLNRPCMEYIIELLKKHGITEIAITLQFLPDTIKRYFGDGSRFGVSLVYFEETTPLGTAGSVKNCEAFLDERFVVISGDALTDFDLSAAIAYHEQKKALATLLLTHVESPLEFGVVMTDEEGKVIRFLEKPNWSEVFSDTVNTGIYVLEPAVLAEIAPQTETDFSRDLFPRFLQSGKPLYGYVAEGYWSDIGTLEIYRQAQYDMLNGLVDVAIQAQEIAPRIYLEPGVRIESSVRLEGPSYIGSHVHLRDGAAVGPYSVLGSHVIAGAGARIERSIVWENSLVGSRAELVGTTVCRNLYIGESAMLGEGSVVGDNCRIGAKAHLKDGVKIWPHREIEEHAMVTTSLIQVAKQSRSLFGNEGIAGIGNVDMTPEFIVRLAAAYAYLLKAGSRVAVSACSHPFSQLLKHGAMTSLCSAGVDVVDFGVTPVPVSRFGVRRHGCQGGIHIQMHGSHIEKNMVIRFFDQHGLPVTRDMERKIENAYAQETFARTPTEQLGQLLVEHQVLQDYRAELLASLAAEPVRQRSLTLLLECERYLASFLAPLLTELGVHVETGAMRDGLGTHQAELGVQVESNGERFSLLTETGERLSPEKLLALQLVACCRRSGKVGLPVSAPQELEEMARLLNVDVVRTKLSPRALMEVAADEWFHPMFDALYSIVKIIAYLGGQEQPLSRIAAALPDVHMEQKTVFCPWSSKGKVMRRMMEEMKGMPLELVDGIKVYEPQGWVLILPDTEEAHVKIISQGVSRETASALADVYARRIFEFQQRS